MRRPGGDVLAGADWECAQTAPGAIVGPTELEPAKLRWLPANVPGTAAGALRDAGDWDPLVGPYLDLDDQDWWFRSVVTTGTETDQPPVWWLQSDGIATVSQVWVDDNLVLESDSMWLRHRVPCPAPHNGSTVVIACRALLGRPVPSKPRARWRVPDQPSSWLRWWRTTAIGRTTGVPGLATPVGPWRGLRLVPRQPVEFTVNSLHATLTPTGGRLSFTGQLDGEGLARVRIATVSVAGTSIDVAVETGQVAIVFDVPMIEPWWPAGMGAQRLYELAVTLTLTDGVRVKVLRRPVGFRTIEADSSDGGFGLSINGVPFFARGACWAEPDPIGLTPGALVLRSTLESLRDAGANMVRVLGAGVYPEDIFWSACDELGLLVWQDLMIGRADPPAHPWHDELLMAEMEQELGRAAAHPSLAVLCGGDETAQQPALLGMPAETVLVVAQTETLPAIAARLAPDIPVLPTSPWGGFPVTRPDTGVSHWFGVGAYLRPPEDARRAAVRFAAICLAISVPPEPAAVDAFVGGAWAAGHTPRWKAGVARDQGASWDFEDVRDHYVRTLYGLDPDEMRRADPSYALDLARAVSYDLVTGVLAEFRRPGSTCAGALVLASRDLRPGAGWGLLDVDGVPKSSWWAMRAACSPVAMTISNEGLSGIRLHLHNDTPMPVPGTVTVTLFQDGEHVLVSAEEQLTVSPRSAVSVDVESVLGHFFDVGWSHRLGVAEHDVVAARWTSDDGQLLGCLVHLPHGPRPREADLGLSGRLTQDSANGVWRAAVTTQRVATHVVLDVPGFEANLAYFSCLPGADTEVTLRPRESTRHNPAGTLRALNCAATSPLVLH